ncbi:MAG TPA: DUF4198 domain-containing protein [Thermoanaerobaculia bacterium]|jgi:uncharacterized GH25 family protein|nr:DUF4198 domain-containing protein [Thermoanaerobaculia bacterium]
MRLVLLSLLLATPALAHDFWIEPSAFHPAAGQLVTASLRVGQKLDGEPLPRIPTLIDRFVLRGAGGQSDVIGRAGSDPAGYARIGEGGLHWLGYQSNPYPVTLEAQKFEDYLRDEGLERIVAARAKSGQSAAPGRERFYRCAKALLETPGSTAALEAPLGFTLELIPHKNPYALEGELPLSLLFRGKPAAGVLVVAMNKADPASAVRARTDAKGKVRLRLPRPGFWLIKAVQMEPAPAGSAVEWESWWASITFEVPGIVSK